MTCFGSSAIDPSLVANVVLAGSARSPVKASLQVLKFSVSPTPRRPLRDVILHAIKCRRRIQKSLRPKMRFKFRKQRIAFSLRSRTRQPRRAHYPAPRSASRGIPNKPIRAAPATSSNSIDRTFPRNEFCASASARAICTDAPYSAFVGRGFSRDIIQSVDKGL